MRMVRERFHARGRERAARAARYVVENGGQAHRVRHVGKVAVHALFIRLVVIGRDHQDAVRAHIARGLGFHDGGFRAVGTRAGDDGNAPVHRVQHAADDGVVLLVRHGAGFARGAQGHDAVRAVLHVPFAQFGQLFKVHAAIRMEGRDQRDITPAQIHG